MMRGEACFGNGRCEQHKCVSDGDGDDIISISPRSSLLSPVPLPTPPPFYP